MDKRKIMMGTYPGFRIRKINSINFKISRYITLRSKI